MGIITAIVITAVSFVVQQVQAKKQRARAEAMRKEAEQRADEAKGFQLTTENSASELCVAYGRNVAGGTRVFHDTANQIVPEGPYGSGQLFGWLNKYFGEKHEFLIVQAALSFSGVNRCVAIKIDDQNPGQFSG